jgi:hypothetical protein
MNVTTPIVGQAIIFVDEHRVERPALVKHVFHGSGDYPAGVNLVFVSADDTRTDGAGRQTEIKTSVPHMLTQPGGGYGWKYPDAIPQ